MPRQNEVKSKRKSQGKIANKKHQQQHQNNNKIETVMIYTIKIILKIKRQ